MRIAWKTRPKNPMADISTYTELFVDGIRRAGYGSSAGRYLVHEWRRGQYDKADDVYVVEDEAAARQKCLRLVGAPAEESGG